MEHILHQNLDCWMIAAIHHLQHFGHLLDNWTLELEGKMDTNANKEGEMSVNRKKKDKIYSPNIRMRGGVYLKINVLYIAGPGRPKL